MKYNLLLIVVLFFALSPHAYAQERLSKREIYQVFCGVSKYHVTKDMKKLSRREVWAYCTGGDKWDAPEYVLSSDGSSPDYPEDWILHNNKDYSPVVPGTISSLETE